MTLLAAVRRSACRMVSGSGLPPSLNVVRATKSVDSAHADARRALEALFASGTPGMGGAESDLFLAQYFYGMASSSLGRASAAKATREGISSSLRAATSDIMDASTAVLRASARLQDEPSSILLDGASSYVEGATNLLKASETSGDHAAWYLDMAAGRIDAAATSYNKAVSKILVNHTEGSISQEDHDLLNKINDELKSAKDAKGEVQVLLDNFPFKISEQTDDAYFNLTRSYDKEQIEVVVCVPNLVTGDKGEGYSSGSAAGNKQDEMRCNLSLTVTVMKGGTLTLVRCTALPTQIRVDSLYMRLSLGEEDREEYQISFENTESNHSLQVLTHRYLELRGVTVLTAEFLHGLLINKGLFESIFWLGKLKDFVKPAV